MGPGTLHLQPLLPRVSRCLSKMKGKHEYLSPKKQKPSEAGQRPLQYSFVPLLFPCERAQKLPQGLLSSHPFLQSPDTIDNSDSSAFFLRCRTIANIELNFTGDQPLQNLRHYPLTHHRVHYYNILKGKVNRVKYSPTGKFPQILLRFLEMMRYVKYQTCC